MPTLGRLLLRRLLLLLLLLHGRVRVAIRGSTVSYTCQQVIHHSGSVFPP